MTKSERIQRVADRYPALNRQDADCAVSLNLGTLTNALRDGKRAEIRGFGSFQLSHRPAHNGGNPKTGETLIVPPKVVPHVKSGLDLRDRVDQSSK